jgi:hypothetical protein
MDMRSAFVLNRHVPEPIPPGEVGLDPHRSHPSFSLVSVSSRAIRTLMRGEHGGTNGACLGIRNRGCRGRAPRGHP